MNQVVPILTKYGGRFARSKFGAGAALVVGGTTTAWAAMVTANDDWDDYFPPRTPEQDPNKPNERIVILGSGWGGLNALQKAVGNSNKEIVVVSPRPHFLYTPLLAGSSVGTITLRSATEPIRAIIADASAKTSSVTYIRADARVIDPINRRVYVTTGDFETASGEAPKRRPRRSMMKMLQDAALEEAGEAPSTANESNGEVRLELSYDKLLIAVGAQPNTFGIPGVKDHALFLKEAEGERVACTTKFCDFE